MRIGIIGGGVVGQALFRCYNEFTTPDYDRHCSGCSIYDIRLERRTDPYTYVTAADLIFVCLLESEVEKFFAALGTQERLKNWVLKSTVPIGTTKKLAERYGLPNLVHSPEFLTERCAYTDVQVPARNIIGTPNFVRGQIATVCQHTLNKLYCDRFSGVPVHLMSSDESEVVKLATNAFFAVKVSFFNEIRCLCDKLELDWETVRAGILSDGRIAHSHTQVPGHDGKRGFGGRCLPKDLETLIAHYSPYVVDGKTSAYLLTAAKLRNKHDRGEEGK